MQIYPLLVKHTVYRQAEYNVFNGFYLSFFTLDLMPLKEEYNLLNEMEGTHQFEKHHDSIPVEKCCSQTKKRGQSYDLCLQ